MTKADEGFTLIELLVYMTLSIIVLIIVGGIFINSLQAERTVRGVNDSSNTGQLVAQSVGNGVRNASNIQLTAPSAGTQLLMTRSVGAAATPVWTCNAWFFGNGEIRWKESSTAIAAPTAAHLATWRLLSSDATLSGTNPVFTLTARSVDLTFQSGDDAGSPILITTSAVSRQPPPAGADSPICF